MENDDEVNLIILFCEAMSYLAIVQQIHESVYGTLAVGLWR
jgi:hypothetical protein